LNAPGTYVFGFAGIVDPDEAERMDADVSGMKHVSPERRSMPLALPPQPPSIESPEKAPRRQLHRGHDAQR
jgi:hypothetical protein